MTKSPNVSTLLTLLSKNPTQFEEEGTIAMELLDAYFDGYPVETLIPFFLDTNPTVRRNATWIGSELGRDAHKLLDCAIVLIQDSDPHTAYYALDIVAACAVGEAASKMIHIVLGLEQNDSFLRTRTMDLLCRVHITPSSLSELTTELGLNSCIHKKGLEALSMYTTMTFKKVQELFLSSELISRRYGAIISRKKYQDTAPELAILRRLVEAGTDDVSRFLALDSTELFFDFKN